MSERHRHSTTNRHHTFDDVHRSQICSHAQSNASIRNRQIVDLRSAAQPSSRFRSVRNLSDHPTARHESNDRRRSADDGRRFLSVCRQNEGKSNFSNVLFSRRNNENRQEFDVCNRDNLRQESLFKLFLPLKTSVREVIRLIAERIEFSEEQIILQKSTK